MSRLRNIEIGTVELISKLIGISTEDGKFFREPWEYIFQSCLKNIIIKQFVELNPDIIQDIELILGQPKAASVHACATLILPENESIFTSVPIRQGEVNGEKLLVSEWEGEFIEKAGYLKEDILGINQLDKFRMIINLVRENYKENIDLYSIPLDQSEVYKMFGEGQSGDVFHLGSKSLTKYGVEVQPDKIEDLIAMLAVYRPGPIEGNAHNEFVLLRHGDKKPNYYLGTEEITKETYSLIIYQEQIMQICQKIGSFSLIEADDIRKAMGKLDQNLLDSYKERWFSGALENGYSEQVVSELWDKMVAFGGYAFNKCFAGSEKIKRVSTNQYNLSLSIEEMYLIKNDIDYAKKTNHLELHSRYIRDGYGLCLSLDKDSRLVKNKIVDIRDEGFREVWEVTTVSGRTTRVTSNHKFPTSNGEKKLSEIDINKDLLFIKGEYEDTQTKYHLTDSRVNNFPKPGVKGFQFKDFSATRELERFTLKKKSSACDLCNTFSKRMEVHHKDGNSTNNDTSNFMWLCPSCHKKEHYKMGRVRRSEKGYPTYFEKIEKVESVGVEHVYDVEVSGGVSHTLVLESNIVASNSHSAAYAITGYICQYLKWKYPLPYWITALEFASDDNVLRYLSEIIKSNSIEIAPPDINKSDVKFKADFETNKILWSISKVKQCGPVAVQNIFEEREKNGQFFSLEEFLERIEKSKVNKSVVENLILAGAFDSLEGVKQSSERRVLIKEYREKMGIKVDPSKDWFMLNSSESYFYENWFWDLLQKQISGLAFFDYYSLLQNKINWNLRKYVEVSEINNLIDVEQKRKKIVTVGFIQEIEERESKKGSWMKVLIEQNYEFVWLYIWSELYDKFAKQIRNSEGNILIFNGRVVFDEFKKENIVQAEEDFQIEILSKT